MDAENITFKKITVDLIWSWGVIHHSLNTEKILNQYTEYLNKEERTIIMIYYKSWLSYYIFGFLWNIEKEFFKI